MSEPVEIYRRVDGPADGVPVLLADNGFRVVRHDLRGHDGSPVPPGPYTLADIPAPTLVVSATRDGALPPERGRRVAAAIPGAHFEILDRAAHLAVLEQSARLPDLIIDHLRGAV
ncbi:alpha/beta hydrolase [Nocardia pseudobrasiliensis]|uniref:Peptidase S33 tripeptidyl aminopeptidase-like C-terminal domain-containing protein n=1 Tax=Nocardia pseudobrasiliensis TaxID=45979 RepID=A0A370HQX2_9NOCA|nr:hypothetical protein [Nocardia pseudobrasiliensis]RDI60361.1 hypothetical protein DFR76_11695 [Nocardia pseudobrasiliensis]